MHLIEDMEMDRDREVEVTSISFPSKKMSFNKYHSIPDSMEEVLEVIELQIGGGRMRDRRSN